jgi:hypothetical protein
MASRGETNKRSSEVAEIPPASFLYDNFVSNVSSTFEGAMAWMRVVHNFEYGDEFEVALCKILRPILPMKYGICRGYVVSAAGNKAGDDIIIYDRMSFPTLRGFEGESYSRKEQVPIEAVYAYIEAKHTLQLQGDGDSSLQHAMTQVCKVKALCSQREEVAVGRSGKSGWPTIRNPIYGAVIARQARLKRNSAVLRDAEVIRGHLVNAGLLPEFPPDLVVAGNRNLLLPVIRNPETKRDSMPSPFLVEGSLMIPQKVPEVGYGAGIFILLWALDWIRLGEMHWPAILNDCITR